MTNIDRSFWLNIRLLPIPLVRCTVPRRSSVRLSVS